MEHVPVETSVTVTLETVQTPGVLDANTTLSPELAVAIKAKEPEAWVRLLGAGNVMVCAFCAGEAGVTVNVCVTGVAAA